MPTTNELTITDDDFILAMTQGVATIPTTGTPDDDDEPEDETDDENEAPIRETDEETEAPDEFEVDDEDDLGHPEDDDADDDLDDVSDEDEDEEEDEDDE